ncbi:putative glucan endo-1,3-beta-glucosidase 13-like [Capsicum annuum]|nr:putative glucan endo-1,3-beta-glucosidase 13-like [Capsicum annuum]
MFSIPLFTVLYSELGSIGNSLSTSSEVAVWTAYILPSPDPTLVGIHWESDSIGHVKALLHDKEGILVCLQQLLSGDNKLVDGRKLVDYGICENSTLHANVEDSIPKIKLYVKRSYAEGIIAVISKMYITIQDIKSRILAKEGTSSGKFSLFHDGKFLEDGNTLAYLNIDDGSTLHLVFNPEDRFLITIESKVGWSIGEMPLFMGKQYLENLFISKEGSILLVVEGTMQIFICKRTDRECVMLDVHKNNSVNTPQTELLHDDTQPHRQMNSVTGVANSVMNHSGDVEDSRANTGDQSNRTDCRTRSFKVLKKMASSTKWKRIADEEEKEEEIMYAKEVRDQGPRHRFKVVGLWHFDWSSILLQVKEKVIANKDTEVVVTNQIESSRNENLGVNEEIRKLRHQMTEMHRAWANRLPPSPVLTDNL